MQEQELSKLIVETQKRFQKEFQRRISEFDSACEEYLLSLLGEEEEEESEEEEEEEF
jgi:hypothetical protein